MNLGFGATGATGATGAGATGATGAGATGATGAAGTDGASGATGATGAGATGATGPSGTGVDVFSIDAAEFIPRTTSGCGIDSQETATNSVNRDLLAFDAAAIEYAQKWFSWPSGWATAKVTFYWKANTGTGSVVWGAQLRIFADTNAEDQAFGTAQTVTDAVASANTIRKTSATSGITPGGTVTAGDITCLQIYRDATNGSDDMSIDALLQGILVEKES
jgi:hypothetical protein